MSDNDNKQPEEIVLYDLNQLKGIGPETIQRLAQEGILGIDGLAIASSITVADVVGKSQDWASELVIRARDFVNEHNKVKNRKETARQNLEKLKTRKKIVTGITDFDNLLGGGIETRCITEFYGGFSSGKSQTCFTLSVLATLPEDQGGLDGNTLYIDVEGTFASDRIFEIIKSRGLSEDIMDKIIKIRPESSALFVDDVKKIPGMILEDNIKFIVIDSIIMLHRQEFMGRGLLAPRQQSLGQIMMSLLKIAELYNVAIVITNQIAADPSANPMFGQETYHAAGGNIIGHTTSHRIKLEKLTRKIKCTVKDSPRLAGNECMIALNEKGIDNYTEGKKR